PAARDAIRNGDTLRVIGKLPHLETLYLYDLPISDESLQLLANCKTLQTLGINEKKNITDAGLKAIGQLTQLQFLTVCGEQVTDAGVAHLKGLTELRTLSLSGMSITDRAFDTLLQLPSLDNFNLIHCEQISDSGYRRLLEIPKLSFAQVYVTQPLSK